MEPTNHKGGQAGKGKPAQKGEWRKSKSTPNTPLKGKGQGPQQQVHSREIRNLFSAITVVAGNMDGGNVPPRETTTGGS